MRWGAATLRISMRVNMAKQIENEADFVRSLDKEQRAYFLDRQREAHLAFSEPFSTCHAVWERSVR